MGHTVLSDSMVAMSFIVFFLTVGKATAHPTGTISTEIPGITDDKFNDQQNQKNIYNLDNHTLTSRFKIELSTTTTKKTDNLLFNTDYEMEKENANSTGTDKYGSSNAHSTDSDISNIPIEKRPCYPNCLYLSSLSANNQHTHELPYLLNEDTSLPRQSVGDKYNISNNNFVQAVNKINRNNTYNPLVSFDPQSMINFTCYPTCNYLASLLVRDELPERNKSLNPNNSNLTKKESTSVVSATDHETETERIQAESKLENEVNVNNDLPREQDNQNITLLFKNETKENLRTSENDAVNTSVITKPAVTSEQKLTYDNWLLANGSCYPNCYYYSSLLAKDEEQANLPSQLSTNKDHVQRSTDKSFDSHEALNRLHSFEDYPSEHYGGSAAVLTRSNENPSSVYNPEVFNSSKTHLTSKENGTTQTFRSATESVNDSVIYHQVPNRYYQEQIKSIKQRTNNSRSSSDAATFQTEYYDDFDQTTERQKANQYFGSHNGAFLVRNDALSNDSNVDYNEDDDTFSEDLTNVTENQNMQTNETNFADSEATTTEAVNNEEDMNFDNERYIIYQNSNNPSLYSAAQKNSSTSDSDKNYLHELSESNNSDLNGCNNNTENCNFRDFEGSKSLNASVPVYSLSGQPVNSSSGQPVNSSSGQPNNSSSGQPVNSLSEQPVNSSSGQPVLSNDGSVITYYIKNGEVRIPIVFLTDERYDDGSYKFKYVSADGSTRQEVGSIQPDGSWGQVGEFAYRTDNGGTRQVKYRADKKGYRQQDTFIPAATNVTKDKTDRSAGSRNPLERSDSNG